MVPRQLNVRIMTVLTTSLVVISILSFLALSIHKAAADVVDDVTITVPVSCNLDSTLDTAHTKTINNGTYEENIGTTTLKAYCNDKDGFSIYAAGYTGEEIGGTNSTKLVGANGTDMINTGTATSGSSSAWAMKLDTNASATYPIQILSDTNGTYSDYHIVPEQYVKVATRLASTDTGAAAVGSTLTTTYRAYISPTQPAGTYAGKVIYTLVHPNDAPEPIVCNANATSITKALCMQDFAGPNRDAIVASMTPEQQYTMKDSRDGKTYTIAKYQVGTDSQTSEPIYDVWMTKNLDLDLDASRTYTNLDTDLGYNTTTNSYDTAYWTPTTSTFTSANANWTMSYITPESYDPGDLYWNGAKSDYSDWGAYYATCTWDEITDAVENCDESLNPIATYTTISGTPTPQYHLGNYYNWAAALATNDSSAFNSSELVEQSICPAGWTLPRIGDGEDSFYSLWNQYGFSGNSYDDTNNNGIHDANESLWTSPLSFVAGGLYGGALGDVGYVGYFWSPVARSSSDARNAVFSVDGTANPSVNIARGRGLSVRCILRPVVSSVSGGGGGSY